MKKFFSFMFLFCFCYSPVFAGIQEVGSMAEAENNAAQHNQELLNQRKKKDVLPQSKKEFINFLEKRIDRLDISSLPKGTRLDKPSSYSELAPLNEKPQKSFWEKIYDDALARVSGESSQNNQISAVDYYSEIKQEQESEQQPHVQIPIIDLKMPDGMPLKAPAYEHIPVFSSQIEILPNRMIKVHENIIVIADGEKIKNGLVRFISKYPGQQKNKIQVMLDSVLINDTEAHYKLVEREDDYIITPVKMFDLTEGIYMFEFNYLVDNYLWNYGDYYEFYWDVTGAQFNLLTTKVIASIKLPGREPAIKRYALTGKAGNLVDNNTVVKEGDNNTLGFMNISPLASGEGMYIFMTFPKVDFLPINFDHQIMSWLENSGDLIFSALYLLVIIVSCWLSWIYVTKRLKFKNINFSSPLLARFVWRGTVDNKAIGCALLDLFRKNLIDIQPQESDIILIRKTAHAKHLSSLDHKLMSLLFSKKDSVCKLTNQRLKARLHKIIKQFSIAKYKHLGLRLSGGYIFFNILLLIILEAALILWKSDSVIAGILGLADILVGLAFCFYYLRGKNLFRKIVMLSLALLSFSFSGLIMSVYIQPIAVIMILSGILVSALFIIKISGPDALLKNAVQSGYKLREHLSTQKESIAESRAFAVQQPYIYALDLEDEYVETPKIKDIYRLNLIEKLMRKF